MVKLEINKPDGSIYWTEHFEKQEEANKWIAAEQTRTYWNPSYTFSIVRVGKTDEEISQDMAAELVKKDKKNNDAKSGARKIKQVCNLTKDEVLALFGSDE